MKKYPIVGVFGASSVECVLGNVLNYAEMTSHFTVQLDICNCTICKYYVLKFKGKPVIIRFLTTIK